MTERLEDSTLLALKMDKEAASQGRQVASRAGKGKARGSLLDPKE